MSQAGIISSTGSSPTIPTSFVTDSGTAIPAANVLNVVTPGGGTQGIMTSGTGNTITITLAESVYSGTATTVGATTANISGGGIPVPLNGTLSLNINVAGYDTANGHCLGGLSVALVRNVASVLTLVGTSDVTRNNDSALAAWNITLTTSGTNVLVQVLGVAGTTINWRADVLYVNAP